MPVLDDSECLIEASARPKSGFWAIVLAGGEGVRLRPLTRRRNLASVARKG